MENDLGTNIAFDSGLTLTSSTSSVIAFVTEGAKFHFDTRDLTLSARGPLLAPVAILARNSNALAGNSNRKRLVRSKTLPEGPSTVLVTDQAFSSCNSRGGGGGGGQYDDPCSVDRLASDQLGLGNVIKEEEDIKPGRGRN